MQFRIGTGKRPRKKMQSIDFASFATLADLVITYTKAHKKKTMSMHLCITKLPITQQDATALLEIEFLPNHTTHHMSTAIGTIKTRWIHMIDKNATCNFYCQDRIKINIGQTHDAKLTITVGKYKRTCTVTLFWVPLCESLQATTEEEVNSEKWNSCNKGNPVRQMERECANWYGIERLT